jgi:CO dehydrogenase/acetyl-CoA synthase alpha subunit
MNRTLDAVFKKLQWQLQENRTTMLSLEQHLSGLSSQLQMNQQTIANACTRPTTLLPEQEIARSHFITQQQHYQTELTHNLDRLQMDKNKGQSEQTRLNTKLKMLERHRRTVLKNRQYQARIMEQNNNDEWAILRLSNRNGEQQ